MSISVKKLLIYIPAYFDYESAVAQARLIQRERTKGNIQIHVVISVNSVELTALQVEEITNSCDELIYFAENLGGDTNINLGYLKALSANSDYLWILSANDLLLSGAITKLTDHLNDLSEDLVIIFQGHRNQTGIISNAFLGEATRLPIGLVSAVIFNVNRFRDSFASALKFSWTGWGQLSVIQNSLFQHGKLSYKILNQDEIYDRTISASQTSVRQRNQSNYRHSFFGYPLIIALLFEKNVRLRNKIIWGWLWKNWYKISFFRAGHSPYLKSGATAKDVFWTEQLSKQFIIASNPLSRVLYLIGSLRIISNMQGVPVIERIRVNVFVNNRDERK